MMDDLLKFPDAAAKLVSEDVRVQVMLIGLVIGWVLKSIPQFPNRFIPHVVIALSATAFRFLGDCADVAYDIRHPMYALGIRGAFLGLMTVVGHTTIISRLEMAVPGLNDILNMGNGKAKPPVIPGIPPEPPK